MNYVTVYVHLMFVVHLKYTYYYDTDLFVQANAIGHSYM